MRILRFAFAAYIALGLVITLWPSPASTEAPGWAQSVLDMANGTGVPVTLPVLEASANVVMVLPFGVLGMPLIGRPPVDRRRRSRAGSPAGGAWAAVLVTAGAGALLSVLIETAQLLIPGRVSTLQDILMNTAGALLGALAFAGAAAARQVLGASAVPGIVARMNATAGGTSTYGAPPHGTPPPGVPGRDAVAARLRAAGCVFAEDEAALLLAEAASSAELDAWVDRRVAGEPLEQIVGWAEFAGLRVAVERGVFVPRRRTELLVREALAGLATASAELAEDARPVVVDLCCGSGAVGIAIARRIATELHVGVELHAADVEPAAVRCTRRNLAQLIGTERPAGAEGSAEIDVSMEVYLGDLDDPLPARLRGRVGVLVANAPYVPTGEIALMPSEARDHEPTTALDGGLDGLDLHRRIAALAPAWLAPGGRVLIETSERQASGTVSAMAAAGLVPRVVRDEELDGTLVVGEMPPEGAAPAVTS